MAVQFGVAVDRFDRSGVFVVELHQKDGLTVWKFGVIGMTMEAVFVRLDDKQVWTKTFTKRRGAQETWMFFFKSEVVNQE